MKAKNDEVRADYISELGYVKRLLLVRWWLKDENDKHSTAAQQTNCSTFHKSTKIGTYVD